MITEADKTAIVEGVADKLSERGFIDEETHRQQHEWMSRFIEAQEARAEFWQSVRDTLVKQGVIRAFWLMVSLSIIGAISWASGLWGPHA